MKPVTRWCRRGFTLVEMLISMIVLAIVGAGLVQLVMSQGRFMDHQEASRSSRAVARSSLNRLFAEVRNVEAVGGVEAAAAGGTDFTLRVPYAYGIMCASNGSSTTLSILPVDSAVYSAPGFSGFAWRNTSGVYQYVTAGVSLAAAAAAPCTAVNITTLPSINGSPAGRTVTVGGTVSPVPPVGTIFFLFRRTRYEFKASTLLPGRVGLWRTLVTPGTAEELAAPLANTARVRFYVNYAATPQDAVPGSLASIRGLDFQIDGQSDLAPRGSAAPMTTSLNTSIFFNNRPD
ncbi:MAG TPA: prepilin-type N-terminal cleavage/methylation domain-containing protein [Gemmatimonadales bacterium]|jgi:prepilin-type N-terminal cleavage/methylation domain-containing protein